MPPVGQHVLAAQVGRVRAVDRNARPEHRFAHGGLALFQYHALGDLNPLVSVLTGDGREVDCRDPGAECLLAATASLGESLIV